MWWRGRYPGYQDTDFPSTKEGLIAEGIDQELLNEVLQLLPNRDATPNMEFVPVIEKGKSKKKAPVATYRLSNTDAPLVKETLEANGFIPCANNHDWLMQWSGPHLRECVYTGMHEYQRVNHFPGSTELTRKDRLWVHFRGMQKVFGKSNYNYMPDTFVLPDQLDAFLEAYEKQDCFWIVKPTASSRGRGIFLLRDLEELPMDSAIIQMYIAKPMLIQGLKFDLRLYVLVTGFDPLKIYIYREGLTRFASSTFSIDTEEDLKDVYKHLTNYSVNKYASNFVENQDANLDNFGHKWSISALNKHLKCLGVDTEALWSRIIDVVLKTLLAVERPINNRVKNMVMWRQNCFELYGFDIIIDEDLKPWLLEVNLSPSMQADSPLDRKIKSHVLAEAFNLVRMRECDSKTVGQARWRTRAMQLKRRMAPLRPQSCPDRMRIPKDPRRRNSLADLSEKHLRLLADTLSEFSMAENFIRVFPTFASVRRYGHVLNASTSSGKFTATHAMINLLFSEKRMISSEFREKRPRYQHDMGGEELKKLSLCEDDEEEDGEDELRQTSPSRFRKQVLRTSRKNSHPNEDVTLKGSGKHIAYWQNRSPKLGKDLRKGSMRSSATSLERTSSTSALRTSYDTQDKFRTRDGSLTGSQSASRLQRMYQTAFQSNSTLASSADMNSLSPTKASPTLATMKYAAEASNSILHNTVSTTASFNSSASSLIPRRRFADEDNLKTAYATSQLGSGLRPESRPRTADSNGRRPYSANKRLMSMNYTAKTSRVNGVAAAPRRKENPMLLATAMCGIEL